MISLKLPLFILLYLLMIFRLAKNGRSGAILHRGHTESAKHAEDNKASENTNIRKATAIHRREASGGQQHWLMHSSYVELLF